MKILRSQNLNFEYTISGTNFRMTELQLVPDHNMSAYLGDPPEKHAMFKSIVDGLILSPVNYATMDHPLIISSFIYDFWNSITERTDANGNVSLIGKVQ
ncbi:hypothetical protein E3N88_40163 [Mikania micrantha]|uniref:Uncharacterized protein n=1 Tax=Mikania micrantha TaxID=192012 RepID=A0A5N6LLX4_9ASTR|nr:hypothetical protein E3N88_40163 [Mikania micrantha]